MIRFSLHFRPDFGKYQWGNYTLDKDGKVGNGCRHHINLHSAYTSVMGCEPDFTNASYIFRGCLSYIWHSIDTLRVKCVLDTPGREVLDEEIAMPNSRCPSDHVSLVAEFVLIDDAKEGNNGGGGVAGIASSAVNSMAQSPARRAPGSSSVQSHHPQQRPQTTFPNKRNMP
jgi:hypothetical protein